MKIDETGYHIETYETILGEINDDIKLQIPNLSLDDSNPLIKLNKKNADLFHQLSLLGQQVYNSYSIEGATGSALEDRVLWLGVTRNGANKSNGEVQFTGTPNIIIPSGFKVATESNKIYYTLKNTILNGLGKGSASIESVDTGLDTKSEVGTITKIVNPQSGVLTVNNESVISGGTDIETDDALSIRYYKTLFGLGASTKKAMEGGLLSNTTASRVKVIENVGDTTDPETTLPPHSFKCFVLGGNESDILETIYSTRPMGIPSIGDIEETFDGYVARFSRPNSKSISCSVNISLSTTALSNTINIIKQNIIDAIDLLDIGGKIDYTLFIASLYKNTESSIISFSDLQFWEDELNKKGLGESIDLNIDDFASILKSNITIGVV